MKCLNKSHYGIMDDFSVKCWQDICFSWLFFFFPSSSIHLQGLLGAELYDFVLLRLYFHQILPQEEHSLKHSFWEVGEVPMDLGKPLLSWNVQLLWADNAVSDAGPFLWKLDDGYLFFSFLQVPCYLKASRVSGRTATGWTGSPGQLFSCSFKLHKV